MTDAALRARTSTEIVDAAFQLLRRHYQAFATVSGIGLIPWLAVQPLMRRYLGADGASINPGDFLPVMMIQVFTAVWFSLAGAAIIAAAAQGYTTGRVDIARAITDVLERVWAVLFAAFVRGVAIFGGLFLFLVGALYFYATYFGVPTTVVLEKLGGRAGLKRSRALADGMRWQVLKPLILSLLIYFCAAIAAEILAGMLFGSSTSVLANVFKTLVTVLVYPIVPITEMLVYYDLRIRKEGYDVELMAARLEGSQGTAAS